MKKLCSLLIVLAMVLAVLPLSALAAEQYTAISTEEELMDMLEAIESDIMGYGNETGNWKLTADITVTSDWPTISYFDGFLDGDGHTITFADGLVLTDALFDFIDENAVIKNLTIDGLTVVSPFGSVGGLVNDNHGLIYGVNFTNLSVSSTLSYVAGVVNINNGTLANMHIDGVTVSTGANEAGGVCYENKGLITGVQVTGANVTGTADGAAGITSNNGAKGTVSYCTVSGYVKSNLHIGGIVGRAKGTISYCINYATVEATKGRVGGILGSAQDSLTIYGCGNYGDVVAVAANGGNVGGITNLTKENKEVTVENCFNAGNVIVKSDKSIQVGGVVGNMLGDIYVVNCYSIKGHVYSSSVYNGTTDGLRQYTDSIDTDSTNGTEVDADMMNSERMVQMLGGNAFVSGGDSGYAIALADNPNPVTEPTMPEVEPDPTEPEETEPEETEPEQTDPAGDADPTQGDSSDEPTSGNDTQEPGAPSNGSTGMIIAIVVIVVLAAVAVVTIMYRKRNQK